MWYPVTVDDVRAVVNNARLNKAVDPVGQDQISEFFAVSHRGVVASIRSRVANSHTPDVDASLLPPEFTGLAALRIAAMMLGRPGVPGNESANPFELSEGQKDELRRLSEQLELVAEGDAVTKPENPEEDDTSSSGDPNPLVDEKTLSWTKCDQDGIGAYG